MYIQLLLPNYKYNYKLLIKCQEQEIVLILS